MERRRRKAVPAPRRPDPATLMAGLVERRLDEPLRAVCVAHHVTLEDVLRRWKPRSIAAARRACCALLHGEPYSKSSTEIGGLLGLDSSSVLAGLRSARRGAGEEAAA